MHDLNKVYFNDLNRWLMIKHRGIGLDEYLLKNHYRNIAIYGMGEIGKRLLEEFEISKINVVYCIDKNAQTIHGDYVIKNFDDVWERVDAIVVTPTVYFEDISKDIKRKCKYPIISLETILYGTFVSGVDYEER